MSRWNLFDVGLARVILVKVGRVVSMLFVAVGFSSGFGQVSSRWRLLFFDSTLYGAK